MSGQVTALTANGETYPQSIRGPVHLSLTGGFGSGTCTLQAKNPSGTFVAVEGGAFTAATDTIFAYPEGSTNTVKVVVTGSTTPTLSIWVQSN